ncbi:hypothetical protein SARC_07811 [Sphaeroforma arctica JP610]|uniref:Uncharacterized protein n=1 Tax=Sphaeroforma arctica JP610 TaxID=667725 RepID=A0A0L0FSN0_9EUKA|nr:hypothetical protein SARC_07811 [Sphaeroforma arctica JP610]KNC79812.1 hypothetical protein SARC_07811 [Sphaeroforma arctica JP610]|eukprot:XP_014153714.1 hypothetical protein SARC_07811 [Sphaeroforma arctica JP610]
MAGEDKRKICPRRITQETFDEAVAENKDLFDMSHEDAVQESIEQFMIQGVDLSTIRTGEDDEEKVFQWDTNPTETDKEGKPHIMDDRENLFLQTDAELIQRKKYMANVNYDKGEAIKVPCKILCAQAWSNPFVFTGGAENSIRKIDTVAKTIVGTTRKQEGPISALATSAEYLVTGSWDRTIIVWDAASMVSVHYSAVASSVKSETMYSALMRRMSMLSAR